MSYTDTTIANLALSHLGQSGIVAYTENSPKADKVRRIYPLCRDALLRSHPWNFAITRAVLTASATAPTFGPAYSYPLPSDCLRIVTLNGQEAFMNQAFYSIESGNLITKADSAKVTYIRRVTDPGEFDETFIEAFSLKLGHMLAQIITQDPEKEAMLLAKFSEMALPEAQQTNAQEDDPEVIPPFATSRTWSRRSRHGTGYFDSDW